MYVGHPASAQYVGHVASGPAAPESIMLEAPGAPRIGCSTTSSEPEVDKKQRKKKRYVRHAAGGSSLGRQQREQWHGETYSSELEMQRQEAERKEQEEREMELQAMFALQQRQNPQYGDGPVLVQPQPQRPTAALLQHQHDQPGEMSISQLMGYAQDSELGGPMAHKGAGYQRQPILQPQSREPMMHGAGGYRDDRYEDVYGHDVGNPYAQESHISTRSSRKSAKTDKARGKTRKAR